MAEDISILISGKLNEEKSKSNINNQIKTIENKLNKVNLKIDIDKQVLNSLNNFSKSMERFQLVTEDANKVLEEQKHIIKETDGTVKTLLRQKLKSGDIIVKERIKENKAIKNTEDNIKKEQHAIENLTKQYSKYGEVIKVIENRNAKNQLTGMKRTSRDDKGIETTEFFRAGQETAYKIVNNIEKIENAEEKAQQEIRDAFLKTEQMRRKEIEKSQKAQAKAVNKSIEDANRQAKEITRRNFNYGSLIKGVDASSFNSGDDFASYIQKQYGDSAELVGKFNDKQLKTGEIITQTNFRVKEGSDKWRIYQATLNKTTGEMRLLDNGLKDVVNRQISFNEAMKIAITRITQWGIATSLVYGSLHQLSNGLNTLKEIDNQLIDIAKVTEYTNEQMKELTEVAVRMGEEYGRSAQEYLKAVTEFSRAGFRKQSEEYAKLSLLLQNVGDVTAEVANETLITANAGFQLGGSYEALMSIIDKFNNISNRNATNIVKLSDAMKVGASVFHSAGLSIDETTAIIGTATASTQRAGSEIARAWRTILMNIRQIKDEEAEVTEESMAKAEKALNSVGIVVRDTPDTFRPMFEIITDLGNKWENLTQVEQAYVANALAGKRQANVLISTLQNYDMVQKQLNESITANGSALKENEVYMQSWEARLQQLTASMTAFWSHFVDTEVVKNFISLLTTTVNVLDKLINNPFSSFLMQTGLMASSLTLLNIGFKTLKTSILGTTAGVIGLDIAEKGLITTTKALTTTLLASPLFWTVAISAGIIGIIKTIDALTVSFKEQKEIVANLSSEINGLQTEYDQLKSNKNRTDEQEIYLKLLEKELEVKKQLQKIEAEKLMNKEFFSNTTSYDEDFFDNISPSPSGNLASNNNGVTQVYEYIDSLKALREEYKNANTKKEADNLKGKILEFEQKLIDSQKSILDYKNIIGEIPPELQTLADAIENILNSDIVDPSENLPKITNDVDDLTASLEELQKSMSDSSSKIKEIQGILKNFDEDGHFNLDELISLSEEYPQLLELLGDEKAIRQELTNIINDEQKAVEQDYIKKMELSENFYKQRVILNDDFIKTMEKYHLTDFENFKNLAEAKQKVEQELIQRLSDGWAKYFNATSKRLSTDYVELQRMYNAMSGDDPRKSVLKEQILAVAQGQKEYAEAMRAFDNITLDLSGGFSGLGSSSSAGSDKDKEFLKTFDLSAEKINKVNHELSILEDKLDDVTSSEQKQQIYDKMILLYQQKAKVLEGIKSMQENELDQIQSKLKSTLSASNYEKLLQGAYENIKVSNEETAELIQKWQDVTSAVRSTETEINSIDDAIRQAKQSTVEMYKEIYEESKTAYEEQKDKLKDIANQVIDIYKEMYQKQKELKLDSLDEELEAEEKAHDRIIDNYDERLSKIEELINAKLKLIDEQESEEDYTKQLTQLQEEYQEIQNKINSKSADDSIETRNEVFELTKQLKEKELEIEELQTDRQRELRRRNLRDELDTYRDQIENKKQTENDKFEVFKEGIDKEKEYWTQHYDNLINDEREFAEIREEIMDGHFGRLSDDFDDFKHVVDDNMKSIGKSISENLIDKLKEAEEQARDTYDNYEDSRDDYESSKDRYEDEKDKEDDDDNDSGGSSSRGKTFKGSIHTYYVDKNGGIYKDNRYLDNLGATQLRALNQDPAGRDALEYARRIKSYHTGGIAGGENNPDSEFINSLFSKNVKPNEIISKLLKGEVVIEPKSGMTNFRPNMEKLISSIQPKNNSAGSINIQDFIRIDRIDKGANLDINKITDQAFNRFVQKLKLYGFVPS